MVGETATRSSTPILLDLFDGTVTSVRDASRATLRAAGDAIEGRILVRFRERIANEYGETEEEIKVAVNSSEDLREVQIAFDNYHKGGMDAINALTLGLVESAFGREHPIGAVTELGRRAGFLSPWSNASRSS